MKERSMAEVTVWHNPRCSKSRGACGLLEDRDLDVEVRRYLDEPPSRSELEDVLERLGFDDPRQMMRTGERVYEELSLASAGPDQLLDAMVEHPILIERPIVIRGDRAVIARPPERLAELLEG
jgi:arsenate reductase (glutaredoxin)